MKKVNITLDKEVNRWARNRAAARNIGICRLVREMLREKMQEEEAYLLVMEQYLAACPEGLKDAAASDPHREEAHES
ncbi:MAG: hypothetical protein C4567_03070 [Deltaproteobacteria bacterium]|nr:MAG: hypothetical protein C4567_03070 [Deltaproteobacteria bacterium]